MKTLLAMDHMDDLTIEDTADAEAAIREHTGGFRVTVIDLTTEAGIGWCERYAVPDSAELLYIAADGRKWTE